MKLYLAGPMRNKPLFNFVAFMTYATKLRLAGFEVVNPVELDIADGADFTSEETIQATLKQLDNGEPDLDYYLARDFKHLDICNALALLDGWEASEGTLREIERAAKIRIPCYPVEQWLLWPKYHAMETIYEHLKY